MEVFFTFLTIAVVVGVVGGLAWFYGEQWLTRRADRRESEAELLAVNEEVSDTQETAEVEDTTAAAALDSITNSLSN